MKTCISRPITLEKWTIVEKWRLLRFTQLRRNLAYARRNLAVMVSFNCDGCGDVVKKPKLAQHYKRCYAPFTCLDCSVQFASPQEAHTSCITEDEKYQKRYARESSSYTDTHSLYKGKKSNVQVQNRTQPSHGSSATMDKPTDTPKSTLSQTESTKEDTNVSTGKDKKRKRDSSQENSTKKEPKTTEMNLDALKLALSSSKNGKEMSLKKLFKHLSETTGKDPKFVKSSLLKNLHVSLQGDGTLTLS